MAAKAGLPRRAISARRVWLVGLSVTLVHAGILGLGWPGWRAPTESEPRIQWVDPVTTLPVPLRAPPVPSRPAATQPPVRAQPNLTPQAYAPPSRPPEPLPQPAQTPVVESVRGAAAAAPFATSAPPPTGVGSQSTPTAEPRAALGPATLPAPAEALPLSLPSERAAYLNNPPPAYPAISRRLGEQGRVVIRVYIDERGMPVEAHWAQISGYSRLDQAAMDAVMAWRYVPAKRGEVPVAMWFNVPIAFDLKQHKD